MRGTYQHCKERHLHRYLAEFDFRYNARVALGVDDEQRAAKALAGAKGKRLTYRTKREGRTQHTNSGSVSERRRRRLAAQSKGGEPMPKRKEPELTAPEQIKRFREAAKKAGVTEREEEFELAFKRWHRPKSSRLRKVTGGPSNEHLNVKKVVRVGSFQIFDSIGFD